MIQAWLIEESLQSGIAGPTCAIELFCGSSTAGGRRSDSCHFIKMYKPCIMVPLTDTMRMNIASIAI